MQQRCLNSYLSLFTPIYKHLKQEFILKFHAEIWWLIHIQTYIDRNSIDYNMQYENIADDRLAFYIKCDGA